MLPNHPSCSILDANISREATMANTELVLALAFYLYPCGLFVTLFSSQLIRYRYRDEVNPPAGNNAKKTEKAHRLYTKLIWTFQLLLFPLLVRL